MEQQHLAAAFLAREWTRSCLWSIVDLSGAIIFYATHLSSPVAALRQGAFPVFLLQLIACAAITCACTLILGRAICNKPSQGRGRLAPSFARYERNYALRTAVYQDAPQLAITLYCATLLGVEGNALRFSAVGSAVSMGYALHRFSAALHYQRQSLAPRGDGIGRQATPGHAQQPCAGPGDAIGPRRRHRQVAFGGVRP